MRQTTVLGLLACFLAAGAMVAIKANQSGGAFPARPLLVDALGAPKPDAALARRPAHGVRVEIDRHGFRVAGSKTSVSLRGLGTGTARWARYSHGVARPTAFGHETVVVTPEKSEQFLTVERRQGPKTWRWRLAAGDLQPLVGTDGAVGFWSNHTLAGVHVEPVALLDTAGRNVTPSGLRWSLARSRRGWVLELRMNDAHLPLPYVIDPAITYVNAAGGNNGAGATTLVINKPAGAVENNLLVAQVTVRGGTGIGAITSAGWTSTAPGWATLRQDSTNVNATQTFWKVAGAAEPASYTWGWGATSAKASGGIIALKGVDNAAPVDQFGGSINAASTTNILAPSITTQTANTMLIGLFGSTSSPSTNVTPPASMTERYEDASTSGVSTRNEGATEPFAAIGATGTRTATTDQVGSSIGQLIALKLDTTNPTGSVTAPAASANVRGAAVTVSSDSADGGSGVANAQFQRSPAGGGVWTNIGAADTTSPYSVAWDTTAVADGLYDLRVVTTDNAANTFTSALITNVRVDNTNPTGAVTAPAASANVRGNAVTVSSNSLDGGSGVANAQFQRSPAGGGVWTNIGAADTTSPYSVVWDSTAVADGLYDLRVITTDNAGNTFTSALITNVRVDNTNPTGAVTAPAASANVTGNAVTVSSNSLDGGSGVANAQFQRSPAGGGVWTNIGAADTTSPYSVAWDTTAVGDGLYDLRVITTDNAGNTFTSALITNVRVDNTNPTGSVTAPAASANVRGAAVTVSSDSADGGSGVANAQFQRSPAGGGVWTNIGAADTTSPYSVAWDTTAVADGLYDLRVITTDNVGKTFTSALITNVRVDNTNPTGSLTAPASAAIVRGNAVTVSSNSLDGGSGVASADFQRSPAGGGVWTTISTDNSSPYSIAWDTTAVADGLYDLRVITTDNAGNTFTSALVTNVRVDNTNPTGSVTAPAASANVTGNAVTVSSNSLDGGSGVANAQFQRSPAGGGVWTNIGAADTTSPYSVAWDTTAVGDGLYDLRVITTDNAGNTFTSALITNVRVDNTNPTGSVTAPAASANVRGAAVTVSSDSADGGSGVANAQFQRSAAGAGIWTNIGAADTTSPYSVAWDTTALADGLYDLRVITTDNVGKTFTSALVTNVRIDNTNPTGSLTAPASAAIVRGNAVTVSSNSLDGGSGVANAQFERSAAGAGVWTTISTDNSSPYSIAWDTTAVADGLYDLRVTTTDNAGNTFTSALVTNVRVDNTNPTGSVTAPASGGNVRGAAVTVSSDSADGGSGVANAQFQRSAAGAGIWTNIGAADTTSPYSVAWDTTGLADGLYDLRVITTDNVGNTFTSALVTNVRVDNTNPTGSITAPSAGTNLTGNAVTVSSDSADGGSGVASAQFQRSAAGAGVWTTIATDITSPYSIAWDTTAVADGLYDLRVITTDNAGNTFTSALITNVRVDNTNPTGSVTAPAASANVRGAAVTVSSDSADGGSGVANAQFQRSPAGAGIWTNIGAADTTSPYSVAWDTTSLADGLYDLRVITTDNVGKTFTSALITNVRVDNTNPTGAITAPAASANVTGNAVTVSSNSADGGSGVTSAQFQRSAAGAGVWTTISTDNSSPYSIAWDTTAVADGLYDLRVITTDNAGNTFTSALITNVRVDNTNPTGSVTAPAASANVRGAAVTVSSDSADGGSGVANAQFQRSPAGGGVWTNIGAADTTSPYSVAWDTTAVADGLYDLRVITTDNVGKTFTSALVTNVRVDNTNPTGAVTAPAASANVTGNAVTVSSNSADGGSGVANAQFQRSPAGGGVWTNIGAADTTSPYSVAWDTTAVGDGLYDLRVITTDNAGNTFTSALVTNVRVDNTNPTGSVTAPAASANVTGNAVAVSSNSLDGGSGVANAQFQRSPAGGGVWTNIGAADTTSPYSVAWDTTAVADGLYDLRVITTDNVGNTFTSALITNVRVDNTNPNGSITAPAASANVGGSAVTVSSNSADGGSGVASAQFQRSAAGAGVWTTISTDNSSPYSVAWDTTALADGLYDLRVITTDNVGNTFTSALVTNVRVDNTNPTGSVTAPAASANVRGNAVTVSSNSADGGSGVASAQFQRSAAGAGVWTTIASDNSSPYSVAWDTTAVADGLYDLRVITTDNVGNTFTSALVTNVRVDNTNPTGAITAPAASANVTGNAVTVSSNSADGGSGVTSAQFQRSAAGAGVWTTISTDNSSPYSIAWDTTAVADGLYDLRVITTDNAGNTFTSALVTNVRVDNTNPTGSLTAPGAGANVTGNAVTVSSDSADGGSGVASAQFQRSPAGGGVWTTIATDNSSPYSVAWDTTGIADGNYDLRVITTDNVGKTFTSAVRTVTVDNSAPAAPALSFGSFTNASATGSTVYYRTGVAGGFTVTGTASDPHSGIDHLTFPGLGSGWTGGGADTSSPYNGVYTFNGSATDPTEPNNVTATNNVAITSSPTSFAVTPDSLAPVSSILCDGASCAGGWYTSSVLISLSASDGGSGVQEIRYTTDGSDPSPINGAVYAAPFSVPATTTVKFRSYDPVGNEEPVASQLVRIDTTAPSAPVLTPSESPASAYQHVSGTTVFYNPQGGNSGTFTVDASASDAQSGIEKVIFPAVSGMTGGGDDTTSPYQGVYDWTASTSASGGQDVTARNNAGLTSSASSFTVTPDTTAPASQTAALVGGSYYTTASVGFATGDGSDAGSGLDTSSRLVQRAEATLSNGNCTGGFSAFSGSYSSPDASVVSGNCYRYRFTIADNVGNVSTAVVTGDAKVDTSAPNATMGNPGANLSGMVSLTSTTSDPESGVATVTYERSPAGAGTWTVTPASWDTTSVTDGLYDLRVVVTNNAGDSTTSAVVANRRVDNTPPSATMNDPGANLSGTVALTSTTSDGGSGIDTVAYQYTAAGQNSWTTTPSSWDTTLVGDGLYDLRVIATDLAGNATTSAPVVNRRVDNGAPTVSITAPTTYINGSDPDPFTVSASSPDSDLSNVHFYACDNSSASCSAGTWVSLGTDASAPYSVSWTLPGADGNRALRAVATDFAANSGQSVVNVMVDRAPPSGGSVSYLDGYDSTGSVTITTSNGTDSGSGVDPASALLERDSASLTNGACSSFAGAWTTVTSPDSVTSGNCYRYRYGISDFAGNPAMYTSSNVAKIDTSAPTAPSLSFSSFSNAALAGGVVYFRSGASGGFTVAASSSDGQSGIAGYAFPALGSGWSGSQSGASYDYSFNASAANPAEPNNLTAQNNAGLISTPTSFTVTPDGAAPTTSIACDGSSCAGNWYTSASVSISLSADDGLGSGVQEIRYTTDGSDPSPVNGTVYTVPFSIASTTTVRFRAYDSVGNEEAVGSQLVRIDNSAPTAPALGLTESPAGPNQHVSGTTLFYNPQGGNSGSFTVDATTSDPQSGIDRVGFPALGGMTGGGDDSSSPYQKTYDWNASSSASGSQTVVAYNNAGLTSNSSFTVTPDTAAPSGGSVSYPNGYASGSVTITTADGTDALSGVNAATGVIERDSTNLVGGVCDPFPGTWVTVASPDSTIASGNCYRYRYRVSDNVGNDAVYTSANVVKVATGAPSAPDITLAETPASPNQFVFNTTAFYNPAGGNSGTFRVTADVTNSGGSGVDHVAFPSLSGMTGGGDDTTSPYQASYDWNSGSSATGGQTVTVHNNAGLTSTASFTVTPDTAPPTGQSAAITGGYYTSLSVPVTLGDGSDALSGIDSSSGIVERESGTLSNGNCVAWSGSWSPVTLSGGADTTVLSNRCYRYRYLISDNVGNQTGPSVPSADAKIDATVPVTSDDAPGGWQNTPVTVTLSVNETGSGIASTVYRVDGGVFLSGTVISIPAPADHSNDGAHTIQYRTIDNAGNVELLQSATVRIDTTLPTTTDDAPSGWRASDVTVALSPGDALSGIASTQYRVDGGSFQSGTSISIPAPADHSNDGAHAIQYQSTDNAGNVEPLQSATVRIDTTLPTGALTAPADLAHVNGIVPIAASASDVPSGVASVEFLVKPNGAGSFTSISTDTTAPYDASWDSTGAPEGNAQLEAVVLDNAGLSITSVIRTVVVDNPPVPTLDDPGANIAGLVTLNATSQPDTTQVVFERRPAGGGSWTQIATDTTAPYSAGFDTSAVSDGSYDLRAVATDGGGFNGSSPLRTARVDNTAPTASVSDPLDGSVVGANVHLAALATDLGSGIGSVRFEQRAAGGGAFTAISTDTTSPYEASWDATGLSGGYELRAIAIDAAGNPATSATVSVTVDSTAPSVTLSDPGSLVRDVVDLSASAPSLLVASVSFDRRPAGGGTWTRIALDTNRPWAAALDTKSLADGSYDIRAEALDASSHVLATHVRESVRVDNTAPTMQSSTPANGSTVDSVTTITVVASEALAAVQGATLDGNAATGQISGAQVRFSVSQLGPGTHTLSGTLVDAAGNAGSFHIGFAVKVEAHAELVMAVKKPRTRAKGATRIFIVPITLSAPASMTATLFSPKGRKLRTMRKDLNAGQHSLMLPLPAASLPPGLYTIRIVATAADGTRLVKRVTVRIKKAKTKAKRPHSKHHNATSPKTKSVAIPVAPISPPRGGSTPPAPPKVQVAKHKAPLAKPLETATSYVQGHSSMRNLGLGLVLLALGCAFAFLIKVELRRMLASPRRAG